MKELERFVPGMEGPIWYEHWHRYHFAARFAAGKVAADVACGEGYGTALLARHARSVTGIDASEEAVALARRRYGAAANLEYKQGRCEQLPLGDASLDLLVSFETLEHLDDPRAFIAEAARVVRPGGLFMVSTPNKAVYTDATGYHNAFHPSEMYEDEFVQALRDRFAGVTLFAQRVDAYSAIWPLAKAPAGAQLLNAQAADGGEAAPGIADPMYFIALCAPAASTLETVEMPFSLLSDRDHKVSSNYDRGQAEIAAMRAHVERIEAAYVAAQQRLAALLRERERGAAPAPTPVANEWPRRY